MLRKYIKKATTIIIMVIKSFAYRYGQKFVFYHSHNKQNKKSTGGKRQNKIIRIISSSLRFSILFMNFKKEVSSKLLTYFVTL